MRRLGTAAGALALLLASAGCASPRLTAGHQPEVTSPAPMEIVSAPFTVRWTAPGTPPRHYALFVDQRPVAPGHDLKELADDACRRRSGCPDAAYLATRGVYLSDSPQVDVPTLPILGGADGRADHPTHVLRVVALDDAGRRAGEASWEVEVRG